MSDTKQLAGLVQRKQECLGRLLALGRKQMELIEADHISELLDVLVVKQRVLAELQQIERAMDPYRQEAPENRRWAVPEDRQRCAQRLEQCEQTLREIVALETRSQDELTRRRDAAADQLQGMHLAGVARAAYQSGPLSVNGYLDLSSGR